MRTVLFMGFFAIFLVSAALYRGLRFLPPLVEKSTITVHAAGKPPSISTLSVLTWNWELISNASISRSDLQIFRRQLGVIFAAEDSDIVLLQHVPVSDARVAGEMNDVLDTLRERYPYESSGVSMRLPYAFGIGGRQEWRHFTFSKLPIEEAHMLLVPSRKPLWRKGWKAPVMLMDVRAADMKIQHGTWETNLQTEDVDRLSSNWVSDMQQIEGSALLLPGNAISHRRGKYTFPFLRYRFVVFEL